ncbi:MAG: hypothetical protein K6T94_00010 [Paenibacillus sp.]|nr:hypothetical protein [Paenibacillus sp.]
MSKLRVISAVMLAYLNALTGEGVHVLAGAVNSTKPVKHTDRPSAPDLYP